MSEVSVERVGPHEFVGRNERGASVRIGRPGMPGSFSPGELLHVAVAGCTAVTVEELVTRRAGAEAPLTVTAPLTKGVREYEQLRIAVHADLSFLDDEVRERVVRAMRLAVARECTVSRTVERGAPVELTIASAPEDPPGSAPALGDDGPGGVGQGHGGVGGA